MHAIGRKLLFTLRGGSQPRDAALAVLLGLLAGFVTGWNFTVVAVLLLALLLNTHGLLLLACWLGAWGMAWLLQSASTTLGRMLLDNTFVGRLVASLGDGPLAAMFALDQYSVAGGAAIALAIGVPACVATLRNAPRPTCDDILGDAPRLLRPRGWAMALPLACAAACAPTWLAPNLVRDRLLDTLAELNGADVTAEQFEFDVWSGKLRMTGLRLADPVHLTRDRLTVGYVTARADAGQLLRGRLHLEELLLEHVERDLHTTDEGAALLESRYGGSSLISNFTQSAEPGHLHAYLQQWRQKASRLSQLQAIIAAAEELVEADGAAERLACRTHSGLGQAAPLVRVEQLRIEQLPATLALGPKASIELARFSSKPVALGAPAELKIIVPRYAARLMARLNLHQPGRPHTLQLQAYELQVGELLDEPRCRPLVAVSRGRVSVEAEGVATRQRIDLALHLEGRDLEVQCQPGNTLCGLESSLWNDCFRRLERMRVDASLEGHWSTLAVLCNEAKVRTQLTQQLKAAGELQLAERVVLPLQQPLEREVAATSPAAEDLLVAPQPASPEPQQLTQADDTPEVPDSHELAPPLPKSVLKPAVEVAKAPPPTTEAPVNTATASTAPVGDTGELQYPQSETRAPATLGRALTPPEPRRMETVRAAPPGPINLTLGDDPQPFAEQQAVADAGAEQGKVEPSQYVQTAQSAYGGAAVPAPGQPLPGVQIIERDEPQMQPSLFTRMGRSISSGFKKLTSPWGEATDAEVQEQAAAPPQVASSPGPAAAPAGAPVRRGLFSRDEAPRTGLTSEGALASPFEQPAQQPAAAVAELPWYKKLFR